MYLVATYTFADRTEYRIGFSKDYEYDVTYWPEILGMRRRFGGRFVPAPEITEFTGAQKIDRWFGRPPYAELGDTFGELINQGIRHCEVVAVDPETGAYLYEYEMPAGTSALRNSDGKSVSYSNIPRKWLRLFDTDNGIAFDMLINRPQGGR